MMKALVYHGPDQRGWDTVDDPTISHHVALEDAMNAYDTFADATNKGALKIVLNGAGSSHSSKALVGAITAG